MCVCVKLPKKKAMYSAHNLGLYFEVEENNSLTDHLDIVGYIHELSPLLDHLLPKCVGRRIVPLQEDGELCDAAEEEGGQGGG